MEPNEIKYNVIHSLLHLNDEKLFEKINSLLHSYKREEAVELEISESERQAIKEGLAELERGEVVPHEEVMARINAKLGR